MITVTRLNGTSLTINALLIETIEETPDTHIILTTGKKFIVREKTDTIIKLVQAYMRETGPLVTNMRMQETEGL